MSWFDNGNIIFSTGLSPVAPHRLEVEVDFASWLEEADPVVSGSCSTSDRLGVAGRRPRH